MLIFIQNEKTSLYFTQDGTWSNDPKKARVFPTITNAVQYLQSQKLAGAAVVMMEQHSFSNLRPKPLR
jgi:hypothetical protein